MPFGTFKHPSGQPGDFAGSFGSFWDFPNPSSPTVGEDQRIDSRNFNGSKPLFNGHPTGLGRKGPAGAFCLLWPCRTSSPERSSPGLKGAGYCSLKSSFSETFGDRKDIFGGGQKKN